MDRLLRGLAALVRGLAGLLADGRRDWVHALLVYRLAGGDWVAVGS